MLTAGEEPLFLLRRLIRAAVEDVGLADPQALVQCIAAKDTYDFLGSPEGELAIAQACLYLATAPKSNAVYTRAEGGVANRPRKPASLMPPDNILNAPTKLMKEIGYGKGYAYDHDSEDGFSGANYWPAEMEPQRFYEPTDRGFEKRLAERLAWWDERRQAGNNPSFPRRRNPSLLSQQVASWQTDPRLRGNDGSVASIAVGCDDSGRSPATAQPRRPPTTAPSPPATRR